MAENSKIEWTDHTQNFWSGCTAVSPACDHCYADALVTRFGGNFANRVRTSAANWRKPLAWNKRGAARVFTNSLSDFFDNQVDPSWRSDAWDVIRATPNPTWMVLTKRPQNIVKMLPADWGTGWPNVWLGCTAENQTEADRRIPHLLAVPAEQHFVSCEPLLGALDLAGYLCEIDAGERLSWVICGGESGKGARAMPEELAVSLRDQCRDARVAFYMKQMTKKAPIPQHLMVREFPDAAVVQAARVSYGRGTPSPLHDAAADMLELLQDIDRGTYLPRETGLQERLEAIVARAKGTPDA